MKLPSKRLNNAGYVLLKDQLIYEIVNEGEPKDYEIFFSRKRGTLLPGEFSEVSMVSKEIHINADKPVSETVASFVHEYLHILAPKRDHRSIYTLEQRIVKAMSQGEHELIFKTISQRAIWDE